VWTGTAGRVINRKRLIAENMASVRTIDDVRAALDSKQIEIAKVQKTIDALDEELKNSSVTEADRRQFRDEKNLLRAEKNELTKQQTALLNKLDECMSPLCWPRRVSLIAHSCRLRCFLFFFAPLVWFFPARHSVERALGNAAGGKGATANVVSGMKVDFEVKITGNNALLSAAAEMHL